MNKVERDLLRVFVFAAISLTGVYIAWDVTVDNRRKQAAATAAGFADDDQMQAATKAGFTDPALWRQHQETSAKQRAAQEREARLRVDSAAAALAAARSEATRDPATQMFVKNFDWKKGGFGSIAIMNFTISNQNNFAVKDVTVRCKLTAPSGTELSTISGTIYQAIDPKATKTFNDVNMGFIHSQSARSSCGVEAAKRL